MIHYGEILEKAVRSSNVSITALARKLKVNRRSIYYWFNKKRLDPFVMEEIGRIINFDFSKYLWPNIDSRANTNHQRNDMKTTEDMFYWKNKYEQLLTRYNTVMSEMRKPLY